MIVSFVEKFEVLFEHKKSEECAQHFTGAFELCGMTLQGK